MSHSLTCSILEADQATAEHIKKALESPKNTWLHMACHGIQKNNQPLQSHFKLHKSDLYLMDLLHLNLPHAVFASLVSCHTAAGAKDLPDEVMHLAAGMQFAGFQGVLATMWAVNDADAPKITNAFYAALLEKKVAEGPDPQDAAMALHKAIKELRRAKPKIPLHRWVPFIHIGI
jgi:CHAT domain-containing protein